MYAELVVTSNFSFLRGASHPEELVERAHGLGLAGLGIADRNSVAGVVRAHGVARDIGFKLAVNDVLYHAPERRALQDVVTCIREHVTIDAAGRRLESNAERHLKTPDEMARLFRRAPEAIAQTLVFLERCHFSLDELRKTEYP